MTLTNSPYSFPFQCPLRTRPPTCPIKFSINVKKKKKSLEIIVLKTGRTKNIERLKLLSK